MTQRQLPEVPVRFYLTANGWELSWTGCVLWTRKTVARLVWTSRGFNSVGRKVCRWFGA